MLKLHTDGCTCNLIDVFAAPIETFTDCTVIDFALCLVPAAGSQRLAVACPTAAGTRLAAQMCVRKEQISFLELLNVFPLPAYRNSVSLMKYL